MQWTTNFFHSEPSNASSGTWLSRLGLWGKRETTPGPVKANLGEEKSFYYDKELKRWVNKNVRDSRMLGYLSLHVRV